jgi:PAS domain S-box-containing protein
VEIYSIYEHVFYESDKDYNVRTIRNIISSLRKKLPEGTIENIYGSAYIIRKQKTRFDNQNIIEPYLMDIIDQANNGITITDPNQKDGPLIYCNEYFLKVFGYEKDEVMGKNPRFLRAGDQQEEVVVKIRTALIEQVPTTVRIRNYTKNGDLVPTELTISPIFERNTGKLQFFLGIQKVLDS